MKKVLSVIVGALFFVAAISLAAQASVFNSTDGTVTVMASGGTAYFDSNANPQQVNGTVTVASVIVPDGRYQIIAKSWADQSVGAETYVNCVLISTGGVNDRARLSAGSGYSAAMVSSEVNEYTGGPTTIDYICVTDARVDIYNATLTATTLSAIN